MQEQFEKLSPKFSFWMGLIGGILAMCTVGFVVLLVVYFGNFKPIDDTNVVAVNTAPTQPTQPSGSADKLKAVSKDDHIRGDVNAPVTLVTYSDLDCPYCVRFNPVANQLLSDYPGKVRLVYRHFPLDSLHPEARKKAEASECVASIGGNEKFWVFLDKIFSSDETLSQVPSIVETLGVDKAKFEKCFNDSQFAALVDTQSNDAVTAGGSGTPYSVLIDAKGGKTPVNGAVPIEQLKAMIDAALAK